MENIYAPTERWLLSVGLRLENIRAAAIPGNSAFGRPRFPQRDILAASPRVAASYLLRRQPPGRVWGSTTLRASFGRGLRAPSGFELAFTDNPGIDPERSRSFDAGIEQGISEGKAVAMKNLLDSHPCR